MDIFAHGLWTNLIYHSSGDPARQLAILLGLAPDVITFAPEFTYTFLKGQTHVILRDIKTKNVEEFAKKTPRWVYRLYNITHSIPMWICGFLLWWWVAGAVPWPAFAWLIHILVDIPTHTKKFFPTPFLWPLSKFKVDGINWALPWFMTINYSTLILLYLIIYIF